MGNTEDIRSPFRFLSPIWDDRGKEMPPGPSTGTDDKIRIWSRGVLRYLTVLEARNASSKVGVLFAGNYALNRTTLPKAPVGLSNELGL